MGKHPTLAVPGRPDGQQSTMSLFSSSRGRTTPHRGLTRPGAATRFVCYLFIVLTTVATSFGNPKRVLVVHSFGNAAPPFTTHSLAFETELTKQIGEPVDLDEISLDVGRYATSDMELAFVEFMRQRQRNWQPDLIVPVGSPAGVFVAKYRDQLFPKSTPIIYTGMDQRRLPPGALAHNATLVGESFDLPGLVEDILQIAPGTTHIPVVIGASPLERYWADVLRNEFAQFTNRVRFTWFSDLSFEQMLARSANMPPHSFILLILLMRDASGVTHDADEALKRMHAVANAPINGIFHNQLGLGIVGGRLYPAELEGVEAARIAIKVLQGEPVTNFPKKIIGPSVASYDWRELRRWNISEDHLPAGSKVLFREAAFWTRYWGRIVGILSLCAAEGLLIFLLARSLIKSRRAERSLAETQARFLKAADAAPIMIWMSNTTAVCNFFNKAWLEFTGRRLDQELENGWTEGVHPDDRAACLQAHKSKFDAREEFTLEYRLRKSNGEYAWVLDRGVPRYAADREFLGYIGTVADVSALKQAEERWRILVESAPNAMLVIDSEGKITMANVRTEHLFGYSRAELIGQPAEMLISDESGLRNPEYCQNWFLNTAARTIGTTKDLLGRRKDGTPVPIQIGLNSVDNANGKAVVASIIDLTERVAAEARLRESEKHMTIAAEAARLGMLVWDARQPFMWTSPQWKTIHGYAPEDKIRFEALLERVHPEDRKSVGACVMDAFSKRSSFFVQHRVILPNGKVRWISKSGRVEHAGDNGSLRLLAISIDITEQKKAEEVAREISGKLITAQEDERRRIARDLHDDLNQRLALLSVEADLLGRMELSREAETLIADIASRVKGLSSEVHKLSYQLHPAKLEQLGLVTATRSLCSEQSGSLGVPVEFSHCDVPRSLSRVSSLCIYRIVQEALRNVGKHSKATRVQVDLQRKSEDLRLKISDNGCGFDMEAAARDGGLGLVSMRERVRLVHGRIALQSSPGQGTVIEVNVPITTDELPAAVRQPPSGGATSLML